MADLPVIPWDVELGQGARIIAGNIHLPDDLTYEQWARVGEGLAYVHARLDQVNTSLHWAIGQWLRYGEHRWGEKYAQAASFLGLSPGYLANIQYVADAYGGQPARPALSFRHHAEVASLAPDTRDQLLETAEHEGWSAHDLRRAAREARIAQSGREPAQVIAAEELARAVTAVRACPPDIWPTLIAAAVRPLQQAPGFIPRLVALLL